MYLNLKPKISLSLVDSRERDCNDGFDSAVPDEFNHHHHHNNKGVSSQATATPSLDSSVSLLPERSRTGPHGQSIFRPPSFWKNHYGLCQNHWWLGNREEISFFISLFFVDWTSQIMKVIMYVYLFHMYSRIFPVGNVIIIHLILNRGGLSPCMCIWLQKYLHYHFNNERYESYDCMDQSCSSPRGTRRCGGGGTQVLIFSTRFISVSFSVFLVMVIVDHSFTKERERLQCLCGATTTRW